MNEFDECRQHAELLINAVYHANVVNILVKHGVTKYNDRGRGFFVFAFDDKLKCIQFIEKLIDNPVGTVIPMQYSWNTAQTGDPELPRLVAGYDTSESVPLLIRIGLDAPINGNRCAQFSAVVTSKQSDDEITGIIIPISRDC